MSDVEIASSEKPSRSDGDSSGPLDKPYFQNPFAKNANEWTPLLGGMEGGKGGGAVLEAVEAVWKRYRRWNEVALKLQARLEFWRIVNLVLQILGASLATLATQVPEEGWAAALAGGVCLGFVPIIGGVLLGQDRVEAMSRAMYVAESIKSEFYQYLSNAGPYEEPVGRMGELLNRVEERTQAVEDLRPYYAVVTADETPMPTLGSRQNYIKHRLNKEYLGKRRRARESAGRALRMSWLMYILSGTAAFIGMLSGSAVGASTATGPGSTAQEYFFHFVTTTLGAWAAVFTTASAAVSHYSSTAKYYDLASQYSETAQRLEDLSLRALEQLVENEEDQVSQKDWAEFVYECETIIGQENLKWADLEKVTRKEGGTTSKTGSNKSLTKMVSDVSKTGSNKSLTKMVSDVSKTNESLPEAALEFIRAINRSEEITTDNKRAVTTVVNEMRHCFALGPA